MPAAVLIRLLTVIVLAGAPCRCQISVDVQRLERWGARMLTDSNRLTVADFSGRLSRVDQEALTNSVRTLYCENCDSTGEKCLGRIQIVLLSTKSLQDLRPDCPSGTPWKRRILRGQTVLNEQPKLARIADCLLTVSGVVATSKLSDAKCQLSVFVILSDGKTVVKPKILLLGDKKSAEKLNQMWRQCPIARLGALLSEEKFEDYATDVAKTLGLISLTWSESTACNGGNQDSIAVSKAAKPSTTAGIENNDDNEKIGGGRSANRSIPASAVVGILTSVCLFLLIFCFFAIRICPSKDSPLTLRARAILRRQSYSLDRRTADIHLKQPVPDPKRPSDLHLEVPLEEPDGGSRFLRVTQVRGSSPVPTAASGPMGEVRARLGSLSRSLSSLGSSLLRWGSRQEVEAAGSKTTAEA